MTGRRIAIPLLTVALVFESSSAFGDTFVVTTTDDEGTGSLRWAIDEANDNLGPDTIEFDVAGTIFVGDTSGVFLPAIEDDETVVDASGQWVGTWPSGNPGIIIDGSYFTS